MAQLLPIPADVSQSPACVFAEPYPSEGCHYLRIANFLRPGLKKVCTRVKSIAWVPDAVTLANFLTTQRLFRSVEDGKRYALAEHLMGRFEATDQVSDQVQPGATDLVTEQVERHVPDISTVQVQPLSELSVTHWKIIDFCDMPRRLVEITDTVGVTNRGFFKKKHLDPLIQAGIVAMTNPENPKASNQRYVITEAGAELKARRLAKNIDQNEG